MCLFMELQILAKTYHLLKRFGFPFVRGALCKYASGGGEGCVCAPGWKKSESELKSSSPRVEAVPGSRVISCSIMQRVKTAPRKAVEASAGAKENTGIERGLFCRLRFSRLRWSATVGVGQGCSRFEVLLRHALGNPSLSEL